MQGAFLIFAGTGRFCHSLGYRFAHSPRRTVELVRPLKRVARTEDVKEVIKIMQNSPTAAYLRDCSFHERLMLAALLKCMKKEGVEQIKWSDVSAVRTASA